MKTMRHLLWLAGLFALSSCSVNYITDSTKAKQVKTIAVGSVILRETIADQSGNSSALSGLTALASRVTAKESDAAAKAINQIDYQAVMQAALRKIEKRFGAKFQVVGHDSLKANAAFQTYAAQAAVAYQEFHVSLQSAPGVFEPDQGISLAGLAQIDAAALDCYGAPCSAYQDQLAAAGKALANGPADAYLLLVLQGGYRGGLNIGGTGNTEMAMEIVNMVILYRDGTVIGEGGGSIWQGRSKGRARIIAGAVALNAETSKLLEEAAADSANALSDALLEQL